MDINISKAQYIKNSVGTDIDSIKATINGKVWSVPLDPDNRHYAEILKQVKEGTLTIKDADE
jgi:hypothetical protein